MRAYFYLYDLFNSVILCKTWSRSPGLVKKKLTQLKNAHIESVALKCQERVCFIVCLSLHKTSKDLPTCVSAVRCTAVTHMLISRLQWKTRQ